jgi:type I restriction enzyme S subunit
LLSVIPKDISVVDTKYLYYCLQGKQYSIPIGGIPQLTAPELKKVKIPIPPMEEQQKIVTILDRFDKLCNDISEGLPAEIEARKKQYEYYRDKLLSFKELKI